MSTEDLDPQSTIKEAKDAGLTVKETNPTTLLLDLDSEASLSRYLELICFVQKFKAIREIERWPSKSAGHFHVMLESDIPLTFHERLLIQTVLGSDPKKEFLSLVRKNIGYGEVSFLFKPKEG